MFGWNCRWRQLSSSKTLWGKSLSQTIVSVGTSTGSAKTVSSLSNTRLWQWSEHVESLECWNIKWGLSIVLWTPKRDRRFTIDAVQMEFVCAMHSNSRWWTTVTLTLNKKACNGSMPLLQNLKVQDAHINWEDNMHTSRTSTLYYWLTTCYYADLLRQLCTATKEKHWQKSTQVPLLLCDNALAHWSQTGQYAVTECEFQEMHHPPHLLICQLVITICFQIRKKDIRKDRDFQIQICNTTVVGAAEYIPIFYLTGIEILRDRYKLCTEKVVTVL